ncbi:DNA-directed 5'-3' RNA polymerase [Aureococcus anophagefferens]|nr:DNA-directed 5'-3' RNA polymerase [Aureococcus anophagefferens]
MCWGNYHSMVEVIVDSPFDGIDVGGDSAPALLADLDGDGDLDLVVGEKYGTLYYYENVGSAASPIYVPVTGSANPFHGIDVGIFSKPALADVDGDGDLDLVVGEEYGALYYYENVGNAVSPSYAAVTDSARAPSTASTSVTTARPRSPTSTATATSTSSWANTSAPSATENVGSAASPSYAAVTGSASPFDGIDDGYYGRRAFADVDGDGDLDLVVGESFGVLFYYENVGSAASPSYEAVTGTANPFDGIDVGYHSMPALADLDGDGDLDLVVGEWTRSPASLPLASRSDGAGRRYEPRCYQFVVFECVRKLALTGLLIFLYPASGSQIAIGLFIAVLAQQVFAQRRPYVADADDSLANVGNLQIILVFIASLMLFIKDMDEQAGAPGDMFKGPIFSGSMVLCGTLVLIATVYTILVETCEVDPDEAARAASKSLGRPAAQVAPPTSTPQEGETEQTTDADRAVLILIEGEEADRPTELASPP